jgi:UDP-N-acetylglucosamine 2-epimerase (non-hydrolysing)
MMNPTPIRLLHVAGARPNFVKVAPILQAAATWSDPCGSGVRFDQILVHTGQHYDDSMSGVFFRDLGLPRPDYQLDVGSGSHARQTAEVLRRLEPVLLEQAPDLVVVVGDVNSTLAAALCAAKLQIPVAHVEAGLRSGDRAMPEELNRVLTDQLAQLLFTTERGAAENLRREGVPGAVHFVGNTMIDSLERLSERARTMRTATTCGVVPREFALVTLHRPSNVDDPAQLARVAALLSAVAERLPVVFPVHARTRARLHESGVVGGLADSPGVRLVEPLGYLGFLSLMSAARLVLTDSGGVQEETTVLGVPCLTLRTTTERPVTISAGTNRLVDPYDPAAVLAAVDEVLEAPMPSRGRRPELWDGRAAERVVRVLSDWAADRADEAPSRTQPASSR